MIVRTTTEQKVNNSRLNFSGKVLLIFCLSIIGSLLLINLLSADILVDNIDPNNTTKHNIYGPNTITKGLYGETGGGVAFLVPAETDYYLDSISVIAQYFSGTANWFQLAIYSTVYNSNESYYEPITLLTSRTVVTDSTSYKTYTADFNQSFVLQKGVVYAAVVYALDPGNDITFYLKKGKTGAAALATQWLSMYGNMGTKDIYGNPLPPYWMQMWNPGIKVEGTASAGCSISGTVNLSGFGGDKTAIPVTVELNGIPVNLNLDIDGKFTILNVAAGTYDVRLKASHWLAKMTYGVEVTTGEKIIDPVDLINGDVDESNEVDFSDISVVKNAFGSDPEAENWNEMADVDGSGEVDFSDIIIVKNSFGQGGD